GGAVGQAPHGCRGLHREAGGQRADGEAPAGDAAGRVPAARRGPRAGAVRGWRRQLHRGARSRLLWAFPSEGKWRGLRIASGLGRERGPATRAVSDQALRYEAEPPGDGAAGEVRRPSGGDFALWRLEDNRQESQPGWHFCHKGRLECWLHPGLAWGLCSGLRTALLYLIWGCYHRGSVQGILPQRVVFLTDVSGIYDRPPDTPGARLVDSISVSPDGSVDPPVLTSALPHDTTGGVSLKLRAAVNIVIQSHGAVPVLICKLDSEAAERACLTGELGVGEGTRLSLATA
ncbi:glutamate 5-kinase-like, partial [Chelydra serpentina]